jgi:membrane protein DedA with SNARE-associated domain
LQVSEFLDESLQFIADIDPVLRTLLTGLAVMLETSVLVGLIVPGDTVVLVASTGVTTITQYLAMVGIIIVGALVGESIGFAIGRFFGPKLRYGRLGKKLGPEKIARADRFVDRRGGIAVFISRFLPVFHSVVPMTAGMSKMPYRRFMAWTAPACTLWAFIYVSVGSGAAEAYRELAEEFEWAAWVFVGVFVVFFVIFWIVKRYLLGFAKKESELDEAEEMALGKTTTAGQETPAPPSQ